MWYVRFRHWRSRIKAPLIQMHSDTEMMRRKVPLQWFLPTTGNIFQVFFSSIAMLFQLMFVSARVYVHQCEDFHFFFSCVSFFSFYLLCCSYRKLFTQFFDVAQAAINFLHVFKSMNIYLDKICTFTTM